MRPLIEVGVLGALLLAALVGTYVVYYETDAPTSDAGKGVAMYVATKGDVSKVTYATDDEDVVIERKSDPAGEYLWVTVTTRTETPPPPPVAMVADSDDTDSASDTDPMDEPPVAEPIIEETVEAFVGNAEADKLFGEFAPFEAARALTVAPGSEQDFGFDEPFGTITVDRTSGPVTLTIGGATYGERSRYMRSGEGVYLVDKRIFTRMGSAAKTLPERRLSPLKNSDVKQLTVTVGERSRTFVHQNPDDKVKAYWADADTPDTKDDLVSGWADTAVSLTAKSYVAEAPAGLSPVATLELSGASDSWSIAVLSDGADPPVHYANTSFNRGFVTLTGSQAEDLVAELDSVMVATSSGE